MWTRTNLTKALWLLKLTLRSVFGARCVSAQTSPTAVRAARTTRSKFLAAALAIASLSNLIAPPALAAEQDALSISQNIQRLHSPHGLIIDPMFWSSVSDSPDYWNLRRYTRGGDSALWTGHYLGAESFRYKVTGSAEALANVRRTLGGVRALVDVTGTGLLARWAAPADWEATVDKYGVTTEEAQHGVYLNSLNGESYYWIGNTSRDQYSGVFFGLATAYDLVNDAEVRASAQELVTRLLDFLLKNNWAVKMPNGTTSTVFTGRYDQQLNFLQIGRRVNPARFDATYKSYRTKYAGSVGLPIMYDCFDNHRSYIKFNLDYINLYNLIRLEEATSQARSQYLSAYNTLRNTTQAHGNAYFNLIDREVKGANATRDEQTRRLLEEWLMRPRRNPWFDWRGTYAACGADKACAPLPIKDRVPTDFLWQRSPFLLYGGGDGTIETAAIDYLLPYWMGRYYGVIAPPTTL
jgi:hypothetical protein